MAAASHVQATITCGKTYSLADWQAATGLDKGSSVAEVPSIAQMMAWGRALLGMPIPEIALAGPSASAVILADRESTDFAFEGVAAALARGSAGRPVDLRLFAKPATLPNRRMGVALARADTVDEAVALAVDAAKAVAIAYR